MAMSNKHLLIQHAAVLVFLVFAALVLWSSQIFKPLSVDEDLYVLMAREVPQGYLPYIRFWEIKPPLFFLSLALFIH